MKPSDIKKLQYGDKVFWGDPEELKSKTITVKKTQVISYDNIKIESVDGEILNCKASEINKI